MILLQRTYQQEKLSTWKSLPGKEENIDNVCIRNPAATLSIQCEIIPRCRYRRQTVNVFVIKIFVLLGPQRPTMPFLTYAYFHFSDIKQAQKCCSRALSLPLSLSLSRPLSPSLSFSLSLWCDGTSSPRDYPLSHEPLGQKAWGHTVGMNWGVLWEIAELRVCLHVVLTRKGIGPFGIFAKSFWDNEEYNRHKRKRQILLIIESKTAAVDS